MITVVMGPCCSGKTAYVHDHRDGGDLVVDMDSLGMAVGAATAHAPSPIQRAAARIARDAVAKAITTRSLAADADAWIIHTRPSAHSLGTYRRLGARLVLLDPGLDVCLARAKQDKRPVWTLDAITDWYDRPPDYEPPEQQASRAW